MMELKLQEPLPPLHACISSKSFKKPTAGVFEPPRPKDYITAPVIAKAKYAPPRGSILTSYF
jgi:hypothetical protein